MLQTLKDSFDTRVFDILDREDKSYFIFILFLALFSGVLEFVGIASIIPFISLITDPEFASTNKYMAQAIVYFDTTEHMATIIFGIFVIVFFVSTNLFNIFALWKTLSFTAYTEHKITTAVFHQYLGQSYKYFIHSSPSTITKNIMNETDTVSNGYIYPFIQVIARSIIIFFISILLIIVDYKLFMGSILFIAIIYFLIFKNLKNVIEYYSEKKVTLTDNKYKTVHDAFNSFKDVKFYSAEDYYINKFSKYTKEFANNRAIISLCSTSPRYIIEILLFGSIFSAIIYLISVKSVFISYLPTLAIFILAAYRVIPMMQNLFVNFTILKFHAPSVKIILEAFNLKINEKYKQSDPINFNNNISFKDINFNYNDDNKVITNLSFKIYKSKLTAIVGDTGSGKTTLLDILLNFHQASSGEIRVDGLLITKMNRSALLEKIGYVSQTVSFQQASLAENIAIGQSKSNINYTLINELIHIVELESVVESLKDGYNSEIGDKGIRLSGGQRQRIGIARALYLNPSILILDESTNALDNKSESKIIDSIKKRYEDITIIMITHRLSSLKLSDNILLLKNDKMNDIKLDNKNDITEIENIINNKETTNYE